MWLVYLSVIVQIGFGIHAIKTGRPFVWVLVIILFPVFGWLGYIIVELIPEWLASSKGQRFKSAIGKKLDPEKGLKAAQKACDQVDTAKNRINLAEQYLLLNRFQEARDIYAACLTGLHAEDPQIMLGLAEAEFGLNNADQTIAVLDKLKATNPQFKSPNGHLLYAKALELKGRIAEAISEYETLNRYYPTPEPACRLAHIFITQGKHASADQLYQSVIKRSSTAGKHFNEANKQWIKLAKREIGNR